MNQDYTDIIQRLSQLLSQVIAELSPQCFSDFWQDAGRLDLIVLN